MLRDGIYQSLAPDIIPDKERRENKTETLPHLQSPVLSAYSLVSSLSSISRGGALRVQMIW